MFTKAENLLHTIILLFLIGAFLPLWREKSGLIFDPVKGDGVHQIILLSGYVISIFSLIFYLKKSIITLFRSKLLWALIIFAFVSAFWSENFEVSIRRSFALFLSSVYGMVLYLRFPFKRFMSLLGVTLLIVLFSSLFMVILMPSWGIMDIPPLEGSWRGVLVHKNLLGRVSAFSFIVFPILILGNKSFLARLFWSVSLILSSVIVVGSRSLSSIIMTFLIIIVLLSVRIIYLLRKDIWLLIFPFLLTLSGIGFFVINNYVEILNFFGKDVSFTGRVPLWSTLLPLLKEHFWIGYGFSGFWLGDDGPSKVVNEKINFVTPNAHNAYIDLWLELGILGFTLGVLLIVKTFYKVINNISKKGNFLEQAFFLGFLTFIVILSCIESTFLRPNNFYWVIFVYIYLFLCEKRIYKDF